MAMLEQARTWCPRDTRSWLAGSRLLEPRYQERRSHFESLFAGLNPGDAAASDMTPIVYSADEAS
jgi:hypothetical protein